MFDKVLIMPLVLTVVNVLITFIVSNTFIKKNSFLHIFLKFRVRSYHQKHVRITEAVVLRCSSKQVIQKQPTKGIPRKRCSENCSKFTGKHPCENVISIKLQSNFLEIALRYGWSPVNLLHIFRTPFPRNTSGWLLLVFFKISQISQEIISFGVFFQ